MEFDAKTAIIIGFFVNRKKREQTGSVFATHAHSAYRTISLTLRNLQHVLSYLPTLLEFFIGETLLTGSEISLP